jgi:hypothetical protein
VPLVEKKLQLVSKTRNHRLKNGISWTSALILDSGKLSEATWRASNVIHIGTRHFSALGITAPITQTKERLREIRELEKRTD